MSTFGSLLMSANKSGISANLTGPYGKSPMTASVYASFDPALIGFPVVKEGPSGALLSGVVGSPLLQAIAVVATHVARHNMERTRSIETSGGRVVEECVRK